MLDSWLKLVFAIGVTAGCGILVIIFIGLCLSVLGG